MHAEWGGSDQGGGFQKVMFVTYGKIIFWEASTKYKSSSLTSLRSVDLFCTIDVLSFTLGTRGAVSTWIIF